MVPMILTLISPEARLRLKGVSSLADQTGILSRDIVKIEDDEKNNFPLARLIHNRRLTYTLIVISGYLRHFDLKWLFLDGDIPRHHAPGVGLLYLWELPFLLIGIYQILTGGEKACKLLFWWFLIAPIAAAPTTELPHAVRTLTFLPTFQIITAYGIMTVAKKFFYFGLIKKLLIIPFLLFIPFNIFYYFHQYYIHLPIETSQYWQYGYKEAVEEVKKIEGNYDKIVVASKPPLDQSYMFFLFYLQYDPKKYLEEGGTATGGFAEHRNRFAKFVFRPIEWSEEIKSPKTLYVGRPGDFPEGVKLVKTVNFLDGTPAIKIVEGQ
jgi:hypothetical protein